MRQDHPVLTVHFLKIFQEHTNGHTFLNNYKIDMEDKLASTCQYVIDSFSSHLFVASQCLQQTCITRSVTSCLWTLSTSSCNRTHAQFLPLTLHPQRYIMSMQVSPLIHFFVLFSSNGGKSSDLFPSKQIQRIQSERSDVEFRLCLFFIISPILEES